MPQQRAHYFGTAPAQTPGPQRSPWQAGLIPFATRHEPAREHEPEPERRAKPGETE